MEFVGEEKRIQALFSELRFADERMVPSFATAVARAQSRTVRPMRAFNLSFALATALLICGLVSLAWWANAWQRTPANLAWLNVAPTTSDFPVLSKVTSPNPFPATESNNPTNERTRALKMAARRRAAELAQQRADVSAATAISSWKSPTATLLSSQNDALLNSLPQLNESVKDLKSFLPNK